MAVESEAGVLYGLLVSCVAGSMSVDDSARSPGIQMVVASQCC